MSIGEALSAARTKAGLTVEQVSDKTRVRQTLIRQIEADQFEHCGGDFYARGHIRNIAKVVGIDPEPLLAEFDRHHAKTHRPRPTEVFEPEVVRPERRGPNWTAAMAAALVVVIIYGVFRVFSEADAPDQTGSDLAGTTSSPSPTPTQITTPAPTPTAKATPPEDAVAAFPTDRVTVKVVVFRDECWMSVTDGSGKEFFEGLMSKGQERTFTDKETVRLTIGNLGAVRLIVNGKDIGVPGDRGAVRRFTFRPGDPEGAG